jgi:tetratricopeptide (TPR) repeat protein
VARPVQAQKPASGGSVGSSPSSAGGTAGVGSTLGTSNTNRNTTLGNTNNSNTYDMSHPLFLSGTVMFDDGTPPSTDIRIERVCNGNIHLESHADSKGHFSFQVGGNGGIADFAATDASSSGFGSIGSASGLSRTSTSSNPMTSGSGSNALWGCELRAAYPGYVSEEVELGSRRSLDDPNVGTIVLKHLANVQGTTISVTSAMAPKSAQRDYEKGMQLAQKGKFEEAEAKLQKATEAYPKYALAWYELGQVQHRLNKTSEAKTDYLAAIAADSKYVSPYDQLALLSAQQGDWKETQKYSKQAIDLNPVEFPSSFWYNAMANFNLKNNADAEKSANSLVKLDKTHRYPEAERMLADFAGSRGDLADAAAHLRAYLQEAPTAKGAEPAKQQLARIEQAQAAQAKNSAAPAPQPK